MSPCARLLALLVAVPVALAAAPPRARGQEPALEVFYRRLEPKEQFKYVWRGKAATLNAGVFRWEVPETEFGTNGLDRNFTGYCAEVRVPIVAERLYRFRVNSLYDAGNYEGLAGREGPELAAQRRAGYVKELFGRYYRDPALKAVDPVEAVALQVALWEVIQETEPAEGAAKFDLFGGDFRADYPRAEAPAFVATAQGYLDSLTGDDAAFYSNADLRGRELVRLQGLPGAGGAAAAQSQFALRFAGGGGPGSANLTRALTTGSGLGALGGFGAPGNGTGTGSPGGSGFVSSGNPGSGFTTPQTSTTPPNTPPRTTPPITAPPTDGPPDQPPVTPTTPIPAPAGFLLGVIALGTIGTWRLRARLLAAK